MKSFFASLLGTIVGLAVFAVLAVMLGFGLLGVLASMGNKPVTFESGSYLVFDLTANIADAPPRPDPLQFLSSLDENDRPKSLQLRTTTRALRAAAKDSRIAGVLVTGRMSPAGYGSSLAALKEVRAALQEVRQAGKPVVAYLTFAGLRDIYLGSVADEIVLDPYGQIELPGLASEPMFFAGALEKFGVGVQVARVGKYKSAVEPFLRKDLSPENREQLQKLLDDLWVTVRDEIAVSRSLEPATLQALVDREGFLRPKAALDAKVVTRVAYRDEVITDLKQRTHTPEKTLSFRQVALSDYAKVMRDPAVPAKVEGGSKKKGRIAVVYAEGAIVEGEGQYGEVGGVRFARELRKLRQDDEVSAIVVRVNSPGGSATAAEHILREMRLAKEAKPTIISMGGYAASGGYWISTYGDRIFTEPATITGSIGVFSIVMDVEKLAATLGVTFDRVKTGRFADLESISHPKDAQEIAIFQRDADWIYREFIHRVAEGRKLPVEKVEEIAQGRVWSGVDAVKLGLADELGNLDDAIRYAAEKAGLGDQYSVREYPQPKALAEAISEMIEGMGSNGARLSNGSALDRLIQQVRGQASVIRQFNDSRNLYARLPLEILVK